MTDKTHPSAGREVHEERREGQERREGHEERREGHEKRREGQERREGDKKSKDGREKREGHEEAREGDGVPSQETYHPSGSRHELVLPGMSVSTTVTQQQRTERVPAPAKLVHLLP